MNLALNWLRLTVKGTALLVVSVVMVHTPMKLRWAEYLEAFEEEMEEHDRRVAEAHRDPR